MFHSLKRLSRINCRKGRTQKRMETVRVKQEEEADTRIIAIENLKDKHVGTKKRELNNA